MNYSELRLQAFDIYWSQIRTDKFTDRSRTTHYHSQWSQIGYTAVGKAIVHIFIKTWADVPRDVRETLIQLPQTVCWLFLGPGGTRSLGLPETQTTSERPASTYIKR
jgi:hypothetical protein